MSNDNLEIEVEVFPYTDDVANAPKENSKGYKVGYIKVLDTSTGKPYNDFDAVNTYLKQTFGTAGLYHSIADWSGKITNIDEYNDTMEKLFKNKKTKFILRPTPVHGGKSRRYRKKKFNKRRKTHKRRKNI